MRLKVECGFGWATDHQIKPKRVGVKAWFNGFNVEFRKRREYEISKDSWEGESRHGFIEERGGLYETAYLPLGSWCVDVYHNLKSYAEAVGVRNLHLDWILDEFDASFNELASGSLRYHMDYAVTYCSDEQRARYQGLIDRLSEPHVSFTEEEMAVLSPPGSTIEDDFEVSDDGGLLKTKPASDAEKAIYKASRVREVEWRKRRDEARHDFVKIMPELWS